MGAAAQWIKLPLVMLVPHMGDSLSPGTPFLIQLPDDAPGKAVEDVIHVGELDTASGSWFQPGPTLAV